MSARAHVLGQCYARPKQGAIDCGVLQNMIFGILSSRCTWGRSQFCGTVGSRCVQALWFNSQRYADFKFFCRVEPSNFTPQRPSRTWERQQDRWNPHLSTVPSEGTGSQSEGRSSHTTWLPESSHVSKSSSKVVNARGNSDMPPLPVPAPAQESSDLTPLPHPPVFPQRDVTGSTIRVVNDPEDDLPTPLPPIPGSRGSEHLGVTSGDNRYSVVTKRGSRASFFRDSIPAWAK